MYTEFHLDPPLNGSHNMTIDKENFYRFNNPNHRVHSQKESFCSVRIYEWLTPTITVGFAQHNKNIFNEYFKNKRWEAVTRITGGRVVLHYQEITYSIVAPVNGFLGDSLHTSYEAISSILVSFLDRLGFNPDDRELISEKSKKSKDPENLSKRSLVCYDSMGFKEVALKGKKLIGSAQKRGQYAFLQHGSIPYYRHDLRVEDCLQDECLPPNSRDDNYVFLNDYIDLGIDESKSLLLEVFKREIREMEKQFRQGLKGYHRVYPSIV